VLWVLWILYPKLRVLWAIGVVSVDVGLVALNVHFLSDVVAGSFVGVSTGLFTIAMWRASGNQISDRDATCSAVLAEVNVTELGI
jgi:membrane-associated phospholipid phosphatase